MNESPQRKFLVMVPQQNREGVSEVLAEMGKAVNAESVARMRALVRQERPDLAILHESYAPEYLDICKELDQSFGVRVILIGLSPKIDEIRYAMQAGARDYLIDPFSPNDLRNAIDRLLVGEQRSQRGRVITVFGTKGGVGKSTVAVNLASVLADRYHKQVVLLDLDLEFGSAATLYGIRPNSTIVDVCRQPGALSLGVIRQNLSHSKTSRVDILASAPTPDLAVFVEGEGKRDQSRNYPQEIIAALRSFYDWIVVDTSVGFTESVITALDEADRIYFITSPDAPTLENSAKGLDLLLDKLKYPDEKIRVVLNRGNAALGLTEEEVGKILDHQIHYSIPSDGDVAVRAANSGMPAVLQRGRAPLSRAIAHLTADLIKQDDLSQSH